MTQLEIDEAVASSTGETVKEIRRRGFLLIDRLRFNHDVDSAPQIVDWDELDSWRVALFP